MPIALYCNMHHKLRCEPYVYECCMRANPGAELKLPAQDIATTDQELLEICLTIFV